ncbi:MAG: hypothetical protein RLZZ458_1518, partial [Planctomycetota bacterium]
SPNPVDSVKPIRFVPSNPMRGRLQVTYQNWQPRSFLVRAAPLQQNLLPPAVLHALSSHIRPPSYRPNHQPRHSRPPPLHQRRLPPAEHQHPQALHQLKSPASLREMFEVAERKQKTSSLTASSAKSSQNLNRQNPRPTPHHGRRSLRTRLQQVPMQRLPPFPHPQPLHQRQHQLHGPHQPATHPDRPPNPNRPAVGSQCHP